MNCFINECSCSCPCIKSHQARAGTVRYPRTMCACALQVPANDAENAEIINSVPELAHLGTLFKSSAPVSLLPALAVVVCAGCTGKIAGIGKSRKLSTQNPVCTPSLDSRLT